MSFLKKFFGDLYEKRDVKLEHLTETKLQKAQRELEQSKEKFKPGYLIKLRKVDPLWDWAGKVLHSDEEMVPVTVILTEQEMLKTYTHLDEPMMVVKYIGEDYTVGRTSADENPLRACEMIVLFEEKLYGLVLKKNIASYLEVLKQ